jgi:hypothetical protein
MSKVRLVSNHHPSILDITICDACLFYIMLINPSQPTPGFIPVAGFNASMFKYNLDISSTGMFALQLCAFGGLAFMIGVVLSALGLWFRTVVMKRESLGQFASRS